MQLVQLPLVLSQTISFGLDGSSVLQFSGQVFVQLYSPYVPALQCLQEPSKLQVVTSSGFSDMQLFEQVSLHWGPYLLSLHFSQVPLFWSHCLCPSVIIQSLGQGWSHHFPYKVSFLHWRHPSFVHLESTHCSPHSMQVEVVSSK